MKRFKLFTVLLLSLIALFSLGACKKALAVPQNVDLNLDNLQLSWNVVGNATRYVVKIVDVKTGETATTKNTRQTKISIDGLLAEGDYDIFVMAQGGDSFRESDWSDPIAYHQDYVSGCVYQLINNNSEYQIKRGNATKGDITIEAIYRKKPVTSLASSAFRGNNNITGVVIGENIREIGDNVFYNCANLKKVVFTSNQLDSIGTSAFHACRSLEEINIPTSLTILPDYMFTSCKVLPEIEIPGNVETIGVSVFNGCERLKEINIPDSVVTIGDDAFSQCDDLHTVTIGKNVQTIGNNAFRKDYSLRNVIFAEESSLVSIGEGIFAECCLVTESEDENTPDTVEGITQINLPEGLETIGNQAFYMCQTLKDIKIPSTVTMVGIQAFYGTYDYIVQYVGEPTLIYIDNWVVDVTASNNTDNPSLKEKLTDLVISTAEEGEDEVTGKVMRKIKEGTVGIANRAFRACAKLANVYLPESIKYVGNNAFAQCRTLTKVVAEGENLVSIGDWAFSYCKQLNNVQFQTGLKSIGQAAFKGCARLNNNTNNPELLVPRTVERIGTEAFAETLLFESSNGVVVAGNWVVGFTEGARLGQVDLSSYTIYGIADYAFYQAEALLGIKGLNNLRYLGYGAFYNCVNMNSASLGSSIKVIQDYTFYGCASMNAITLPSNVQYIGRAAFYKCQKLTELDFSRCTDLVYIGENAFYNCSNVMELDFGTRSTLKYIGNNAFYKCATGGTSSDSGLKTIVLPDTLEVLGERAFMGCYLAETIQIGAGLTSIPAYAFRDCDNVENLVIPGTIQVIGKYAFAKMDNLRTLVIEEGVTTVGDNAFYEATSLNNVVFADSVTSIGKYAFKGCRQMRTVILPANVETIGMHAFYGCKNMTIYAEAASEQEGWHLRWNSSYRPLIFNAILAEDNSYVVSVNLKEGGFVNMQTFTDSDVIMPERLGYVATGWDKAIPEVLTAEGVVLTVTWVEGYSIKYVLDGGLVDGVNPYHYYSGSGDIVLGGATKSERILNPDTNTLSTYVSEFLGWYDADGNKVEVITSEFTGDIVLTARWGEPTLVGN